MGAPRGRAGGLDRVAGRGMLGEHWCRMATQGPLTMSFSSSRPGEAAPQEAQVSPCHPLSIITRAARYP